MPTETITLLLAVLAPIGLWLAVKNPIYLLGIHVLSRVVLDSLPELTYVEVSGALSFMEVYTIAFMALIIVYLLAKSRLQDFYYTAQVVVMVSTFAVSAMVSFQWADMLAISARWLYLWSVLALVVYTMLRNTPYKTILYIWICLLYPQVNQFYHYLYTPPKMDRDVWSYMGSYEHESNLGFLLLGALMCATYLFFQSRQKVFKAVFLLSIAYLHWAIYINNYRTATAAIAVYWAVMLYMNFSRVKLPSKAAIFVLGFVSVAVVSVFLGERLVLMFNDVLVFLGSPGTYIDFSGTARMNNLFSGRLDILNVVMSEWINSSFLNIIFGLGPGAIDSIIGVYAHNEYLSALAEMGIVGLLALAVVSIKLVSRSFKISKWLGLEGSYFFSILIGIFVMALATMPFRNMRAMLIMAIALGALEALRIRRQKLLQKKRNG